MRVSYRKQGVLTLGQHLIPGTGLRNFKGRYRPLFFLRYFTVGGRVDVYMSVCLPFLSLHIFLFPYVAHHLVALYFVYLSDVLERGVKVSLFTFLNLSLQFLESFCT